MRDDITLFYPGDGVKTGSNCAHYKGIKDFKANANGTVTFKTQKFGIITTAAVWRLKTGLADDAPLHNEEENAAPAGNQARGRRNYGD